MNHDHTPSDALTTIPTTDDPDAWERWARHKIAKRERKRAQRRGLLPVMVATLSALLLVGLPYLALTASAAPIPEGGPRLFGQAAPDATLIGVWYFDAAGAAQPISGQGGLLEAETIHVTAYAPLAKTVEGSLLLTFVWEQQQTVHRQTVVNGTVETTQEVVWNETGRAEMAFAANQRGIENTEIQLPRKEGERLTIKYAGEDRRGRAFEVDLAQVTHHTSPLFFKKPRETLQEDYLNTAGVVAAALAATIVGLVVSRKLYRAAGDYVPPLDPVVSVLGSFVGGGILGFIAWTYYRERLVLEGLVPLLLLYTVVVVIVSLQVWRREGDVWMAKRYAPTVESAQPEVRMWSLHVAPDRTTEGEVQLVSDSWWDFVLRAFGGRTVLRLPDQRNWHYDVPNHPYIVREHLLEADLPPATCEECLDRGHPRPRDRPHVAWEREEGQWFARPRFHRTAVRELPLSAWGAKVEVLDVLSNLIEMEKAAEERTALQVKNAQLEATVKAGIVEKARGYFEQFLFREHAALTGKPVAEIVAEASKLRKLTEPKELRRAVNASAGAIGTTSLTPTNGDASPAPPAEGA